MIARTRNGALVETYDGEKGAISFLYENPMGQQLLKLLIQPWVSRLAGAFLSTRLSRWLIGPFVRKNRLELSDYPQKDYGSFNDFFSRTILPGRRPLAEGEGVLVAPCDGKLTVMEISEELRFFVKGAPYTLERLLRDGTLAEGYRGGKLLLFRLSVDDYHRYCFPVTGTVETGLRIQGVYHTVNPLAAEKRPIYRENTREYVSIQTQDMGNLLMMEVGAMLVGRIRNHHVEGPVQRGQEKGYFQFGGSTVILILEPGRVEIDEDLLSNSRNGEETIVKMGERIGYARENQRVL